MYCEGPCISDPHLTRGLAMRAGHLFRSNDIRSLFHVEQSVDAVGSIVRTWGTIHDHRTLDPRLRGKGEMAYPEDEIGPPVDGDAFAHSFDYPFFEVKTECL